MRTRTWLGLALCMLVGCAPTTVRVAFSTDGDVALSTLTVQIALGDAAPDAPRSLAANDLTTGSFLVALDGDPTETVAVTLAGTTSSGEAVSATGSVTSVAHSDAKLALVLTCGVFCDDFDDRTTLQGKWTTLGAVGGASLTDAAISTAESVSAPQSAMFHARAYSDIADNDGVTMTVDFPLTSSSFSLDFDVRADSYTGGNGFVGLAEVRLGGVLTDALTLENPTQVTLTYDLLGTSQGESNLPDYYPHQPLTQSAWHHVHFAEHFDASAGSLVITWDGTVVCNATNIETWAASGAIPQTAAFTIGSQSHQMPSAADLYFDNVRIQ